MIEVSLSPSEQFQAAHIGCQRHLAALQAGLTDKHAAKTCTDPWALHIEGAAGELAFAKATNRYWPATVNNFHDPDLMNGVQVRTRSSHSHDLIVREGDSDLHTFVLVTGRMPVYRVHGWIKGRDAKQLRFWNNPGGHGPAFFIPQGHLTEIDARVRKAA